jgi:SNF2 family DNA or RNA helicase
MEANNLFKAYESLINFNTLLGNDYNFIDIANEGFFDFLFKSKSEKPEKLSEISWRERIFGSSKGFLGKPMTFQNVIIKDGYIKITGISYNRLKDRVTSYYSDDSIINIFLKGYNASSYKRYLNKKIPKSAILIEYIYTPIFFALEIVKLFETLSKRYRDASYHNIAASIYKNTWLSKADSAQSNTALLSLNNLDRINLELNVYQKEFIENYPKLKAFLNLRGYILAFEQGLGKTLTAVGLAECLNKDRVYIICPNTLKENWALEIKKYYTEYSKDADLWKQSVYICDNPTFRFDVNTTRFIITNNESINKMIPFAKTGNNLLIIDESHNFRNLNGKRVNELIEFSNLLGSDDVLVMSGTPIKAAPSEIVPALMLIDPSFTEEAAQIYSKAFNLSSSTGTAIVQSRFGKIIYRKEKDELKGLPEKHVDTISFSITDKDKYRLSYVKDLIIERYRQIYSEELLKNEDYRDRFVTLIDRYSTSSNDDKKKYINWVIKTVNTSRSMALHEIDAEFMDTYLGRFIYPTITNKDTRDEIKHLESKFIQMERSCMGRAIGEILPKYRRDMFIKLWDENKSYFITEIKKSIKKIIIFSQFKDVVNHITDDLNNSGIVTVKVTGDVVNKARLDVFTQFKEDDVTYVLCATSQTVGTGVTLVEANQMFFFGAPWRQTDFEQCSDRIHRIGQTDDVYIWNVLLDTGEESNLSNRMENILKWSQEMFRSFIIKTDSSELENKLIQDEKMFS